MTTGLGKKIRQGLRNNLGPGLAAGLIRLYNKMIRWEFQGWDRVLDQKKSGPVIMCHWHGDDLALMIPFADRGLTMLVSHSKDGDFISGVLSRLGYAAVRGSSSRGGGRALRELAGVVRSGKDVGLTIDGPRGPRTQVKAGVVVLARLSGAPIFPTGVWTDQKWVFAKTWHKTYLPKPGALVRIVYGEPIFVPADATREQMEDLRKKVEDEFFRLHDAARQGA